MNVSMLLFFYDYDTLFYDIYTVEILQTLDDIYILVKRRTRCCVHYGE